MAQTIVLDTLDLVTISAIAIGSALETPLPPPVVWLHHGPEGYRAVHRRPLQAVLGCDGLVRSRDAHVLGPPRRFKSLAVHDRTLFQTAYARAGAEGLFRANRALSYLQHPSTLYGWEVEVEMMANCSRVSRAVCHIRDENTVVRVEGHWQNSRRLAELDLACLRRAYDQHGLQAAQRLAARVEFDLAD